MKIRRSLRIFALLALAVTGCSSSPSFRHGRIPTAALPLFGSASVTYGRMPDIGTSLAALQKGVSDKGDVLRVLGAPKGYGMARLTGELSPHVVWHYEYLETHENKFKIKVLLLFFDKEKYDGYIWFSSFQEMQRK